jgi:hypothetical protein
MFRVQEFNVDNKNFRAIVGTETKTPRLLLVEVQVSDDLYRVIPRGKGTYKLVQRLLSE